MKSSKRTAYLLGVLAIVALVFIALFVSQYGETLAGRITNTIKPRSAAQEKWWCKDPAPQQTTEVTGEASGGEHSKSSYSKSSSDSSSKYSFDTGFTYSFWEDVAEKKLIDPGWILGGGNTVPGNGRDLNIPEINPKNDSESEFEDTEWVSASCECLGETVNAYISQVELDELYGGSREKYCKETYDNYKYCQNPTTVTCTCGEISNSYLISQNQIDDLGGGKTGVQKFCDMATTKAYCDPYYFCSTGKEVDYEKLGEECAKMYVDAKKNQCGGGSFSVDKAKALVCEAFKAGSYYLEDLPCATEDQCEELLSIFDNGGFSALKGYLDDFRLSYSIGETCYNLYGIGVPSDGSKGWAEELP